MRNTLHMKKRIRQFTSADYSKLILKGHEIYFIKYEHTFDLEVVERQKILNRT